MLMVVLWAALAAPALCIGGLLEHPCECCNTDGCSHEACPDDPCSTLAAMRHEQHVSPAVWLAAVLVPMPAPEPDNSADDFARGPFEPPRCRSLPFPPSDVPLLI
jgi:hypothetical protein